jgi:hypothetical protein
MTPGNEPYFIVALITAVGGFITVAASAYVSVTNASKSAKIDALASANKQIELLTAQIGTLQKAQETSWAEFQEERARWQAEREQLIEERTSNLLAIEKFKVEIGARDLRITELERITAELNVGVKNRDLRIVDLEKKVLELQKSTTTV